MEVKIMSQDKNIKKNAGVYRRMVLIAVMDVFSIFGSYFAGLWLLNDFHFSLALQNLKEYLLFTSGWCVFSLLVFFLCNLYNSIWSFASVDELFHIIGAYLVLAVGGTAYLMIEQQILPTSFFVLGAVFSFI